MIDIVENCVLDSFVVLEKGTRSRLGGGGAQYFVSTDLNLNRLVRAFSLAWPVPRQIYYGKRRRKQ